MALVLVHLTVRIRDDVGVRIVGERAAWLWTHLRRAFPKALAVVLMPNHPHVIAWVPSAELARAVLVKIIAAFSRRFRLPRSTWQRAPPPKLVEPGQESTVLRYVALNPARRNLVKDPLAWYWSTYADVVGAIADPWVAFDAIAPHLPRRLRDRGRLHDFVSSDKTTNVAGTPRPVAARDAPVATRALDDILLAAIAATRSARGAHRSRGPARAAFVWLAVTQGWDDVPRLARLCGMTRNAIQRILRGAAPQSLDAARLFLGDARLLDAARVAIGWCSTDEAPVVDARKSPNVRPHRVETPTVPRRTVRSTVVSA